MGEVKEFEPDQLPTIDIDTVTDEGEHIGGNSGRKVYRLRHEGQLLIAKTFPAQSGPPEMSWEMEAMTVASALLTTVDVRVLVYPANYRIVVGNELVGFCTLSAAQEYPGAEILQITDETWERVPPEARKILKSDYRQVVDLFNITGVWIDGFDSGVRRNTSLLFQEDWIAFILYDLSMGRPADCRTNHEKRILNKLDFDLPS